MPVAPSLITERLAGVRMVRMVKLDYVEVKFKLRQPSLFRNDWFELEDEEEQDLYKQAIDKALKYQCFPSKVIMVLGKKRLHNLNHVHRLPDPFIYTLVACM